jgi:hypothetical protein
MSNTTYHVYTDFLIHAPSIPQWFKRKEWAEKIVVKDIEKGGEWVRLVDKKMEEDDMDYLVRWRFAYADAMEKERKLRITNATPKIQFDLPLPQEITDNGRIL